MIAVMEVDHADLDDVVRGRRAMLEIDLMAEHVTIVRGKLQLVVVGKPVVTGLVGDLADSWISGCGVMFLADEVSSGAEGEQAAGGGAEKVAAVHESSFKGSV